MAASWLKHAESRETRDTTEKNATNVMFGVFFWHELQLLQHLQFLQRFCMKRMGSNIHVKNKK